MSNATLANNATVLAVSSSGPDNFDFGASVSLAAQRQVKGVTRERQTLNRQKLIASVCADFRNHFVGLYGKSDRLPADIFVKVESAVDSHIDKVLSAVNRENALNMRRAFFHDAKQARITERVVITGENLVDYAAQKIGVNAMIEACNRRIKDLEAKKTPDFDREKQVKAQLQQLQITATFISAEIERQKVLKP